MMRWMAGLIGSVMSALPAEVTIRSNQRCWRNRAIASAKVGAGFGYHAARRGELRGSHKCGTTFAQI